MLREISFGGRWAIKIVKGPLLSVELTGLTHVCDLKKKLSELFPGISVDTMRFIARGEILRDSDELKMVKIGMNNVVIVSWPAYINKFSNGACAARVCVFDKIKEAVSRGNKDEIRCVLKDATEQGHLFGQGQYGLFLIQNGNGSEDEAEGSAYLKAAAEHGDLESEFSYGRY